MHTFSNYVYAKLNLEFDRELFVKEYDKFIFPYSMQVTVFEQFWKNTRNLNQSWNMIDPVLYDEIDILTNLDPYGESPSIVKRGRSYFRGVQLLQLQTEDSDSEYVKKHAGDNGSLMRNHHLHRTWKLKPQFQHLNIVKFILQKLPLTKIVNLHCVSLEPGSFSCIHRDARFSPTIGLPFEKNNGLNNGLYQQGYVTIALNVSDGGVPLYWSLDGEQNKKPYQTNDLVYMHSDYFLHGVPVCTSRRRQIRITGIPSSKLANLIDHTNKIVLPNDYVFDKEEDLYPG